MSFWLTTVFLGGALVNLTDVRHHRSHSSRHVVRWQRRQGACVVRMDMGNGEWAFGHQRWFWEELWLDLTDDTSCVSDIKTS